MKYIKLYQYQVEREGGQRYGPLWMHRSEAEHYIKKGMPREFHEAGLPIPKKLHVVRIWVKASKNKFRSVKPEIVRRKR